MRIIEVVIDAKGQSTIQTKGFTGANCQDASRLLEQALGQTQSETRTAEYYHPAPIHTEQQHQS